MKQKKWLNRAFSELWNNFKQLNKQRGKGQKNRFKKLMAKKFSKSDKNYKLIDPKVQQFPSTRNKKKTTPRQTIIKLCKTSDRLNLKSSQWENRHYQDQRQRGQQTSHWKQCKPEDSWLTSLRYWKKDSPYIQVYTQQQCFKNKGKIKTFPDTHAKNPPPADENLKMSEAVSQVEANDDRCISGTTEMDKEHQKW